MNFDEWLGKMKLEHKVPFGTAYEMFARKAWDAATDSASALLRAREAKWRALADNGGSDMHSEEVARTRAWEAMTCAEEIKAAAGRWFTGR